MALQVQTQDDRQLMPPPGPRGATYAPPKPQQLVLEEDEWAEQLEAIIERDFFPDVPKLQSKLEWLQALRSRDPAALRQAQVNIAARRAGIRTPIGATPGTFDTPGASLLRAPHTGAATPAQTPLFGRQQDHDSVSGIPPDGTAQRPAGAPMMTLDRFLWKHTSEDNASFAELLVDMNAKRAKTHEWMHRRYEQPALTYEESAATEERTADGFGTGGQAPLRLLHWAHEPKNRLFYDSSQQRALALSDTELAARVAGPPKQIKHRNTRFVSEPAVPPSGSTTPGSDSQGGTPAAEAQPSGPLYDVLATPSFTPGADGESPFMTWGDIAATPMRLDQEDTPLDIGGGPGPQFRVAEVPKKDVMARHMAAKAGVALKRRAAAYTGSPLAQQAAAAAQTPGGSKLKPGGAPGQAGTPLSAAGRRLASSLRGKGSNTPARDSADAALRASYRPGSTPQQKAPNTPRIDTTEAAKLAKLRAAALDNKHRLQDGRPGGKLTDDLLDF